ncbi:MAG: hypothetical protein ACSLFP_16125 [Acidimicrobiales bacterium]
MALPAVVAAEAPAPRAPAAPPAAPLSPPSPALPGLPEVSLDLAEVEVSGPAFDRAARRYAEVEAAHTATRDARAALDHRASVVRARLDQLRIEQAAGRARLDAIASRLDDVEAAITALAVRAYTGGGDVARVEEALVSETPAIHEADRREVLGQASLDVLLAERAAYRARADLTEEGLSTAAAEEAVLTDELAAIGTERPAAVTEEQAEGRAVAEERVRYEEARVLAPVRGVDFQLVALDAYHRAAAAIAASRPQCGVEWWALAGVSKVEGRHGTYGGATLDPRGDTSRRIIGIQLNGTNETAAIADSDGGELDGDPLYDRAVGPMQFIPQTWSRFRADGNGDGEMSPFNLYDATLAAADYLCTSSSGLGGDGALHRAYLSYNHSVAYADSVLGHARFYERAISLPGPGA